MIATKLLEHLGYSVFTATSPSEALQVAEDHTSTIQLMITDLIMPEMNGRDLAQNVLVLKRGIKILFMSGYSSDIISSKGIFDEEMDFIQKPFSKKELDTRIREILNR